MTLDCAIGFVFQIVLFFPISLPVTVYDLVNGEQICYYDERQTNGKNELERNVRIQSEEKIVRGKTKSKIISEDGGTTNADY